MRRTNDAIAEAACVNFRFTLLAAVMLSTPVFLFVIGVARNSVFLIDGSGALFGTDIALLLWLRDQWVIAPHSEG